MRVLTVTGRWLIAVLGLAVLCIVLALGFFNPNARRSDIEAWVSEQTGHRFTFAGELGWRVWPRFAITLPPARLEAAVAEGSAGAVAPAFAEWRQASLSARLWPLLRGRLEFGAVRLSGLRLRLRRDAAGRNNWQELLQRFTQEQPPGRFKFARLAGVQVTDAEITVDDAAANRLTTLRIEALRTTAVTFGQPIDVALQAQAMNRRVSAAGSQSLDLPFTLRLQARTDAALQRWQVDDLRWEARLTAQGWPEHTTTIQALPMMLRWRHAEAQDSQQLVVNALQAAVGDAQLSSRQLHLMHLNETPQVAVTLEFAVANLRQWLNSLGIATPRTRDATVLQKLSVQVQARGNIEDLRLQPLLLRLDQTQVAGMARMHIADGKAQYQMDLRADHVDLDRYLPVAVAGKSARPPAPVPIEWLRNLRAQGRLHVDAAQWQGLRAQQLTMTFDGT